MLNLSNVTLLCVETRDPELAHWAIDRCLEGTRFAKVVLLTNIDLVKNKRADIEIEKYMRIVEGGKAGAAKRWSNKPALKKDSPPMPPPLGRQY